MNTSDKEQLAQELVDWLSIAPLPQISEYARRVTTKEPDAITEIRETLIEAMFDERSSGLNQYIDTDLIMVAQEVDVMRFIAALAQYSTESVIENFQKLFPQAHFTLKDPNASVWAGNVACLFDSAYYFLAAPDALRIQTYIQSFITYQSSFEEIANFLKKGVEATQALARETEVTVYMPHQPSVSLQQKLNDFLSILPFLPKTIVDQYCQSPDLAATSLLVHDIIIALIAFWDFFLASEESPSEPVLFQMVWDDFRLKEEAKVMHELDIYKATETSTLEPDPASTEVFEKLSAILSERNVLYGTPVQDIYAFWSTIPISKRTEIKEYVRMFCVDNLQVTRLLDPINADTFIKELEKRPTPEEKATYIASFKQVFADEVWPQTLMMTTVLATVF